MKTNEPSFQNYLVKDGQAVPENPFYYIMGSNVATDYSKFETWKQSHSYATDANDGSWTVERFETPVWQHFDGIDWVLQTDEQMELSPIARTYNSFFRQFAKFKEEVEKLKESETLTIGNISFKKLGNGYIWLTATEGVTIELQPDEIEQLAKFIK